MSISNDTQPPASTDSRGFDNNNALLALEGLPAFARFRPDQVDSALDQLMQAAERALETALSGTDVPTWDGFVLPLQEATERLGRAWGMVRHLNSVVDTPALREAFNRNLPRVTEFWTRLGQSEALFARYRALHAAGSDASAVPARARVVANELRDFRLGGAELVSPARERYAAIQEELAGLQQQFSEHVLDATGAFEVIVTDARRLAGLPPDAVAAARADAERRGDEGWRFTLQMPSYLPVLQYADDRALREELYRGYATRATSGSTDNTGIVQRILALREEKARLLGYGSFAELSLVPKMAESPQAVVDFLLDLADRARPWAEADLDAVRRHAAEVAGIRDLQAWDVSWVSEQLKKSLHGFSDQEVKPYFPLPRVLDGLFGLIQRLFSVSIRPDVAEVWHPEVRFFRIESEGRLVGQFYLDLYAREAKQSGAWMDDCRGRVREARLAGGAVRTPIAYLVCNFQPPVGDQPSLLTHDDVITLFHEFGHGLHHMLTRVDTLGVSGISGVEWDAVELPSQFMENWAWEWECVEGMSGHVVSGEPLPRALFDRMVAARHFQAGLQTLRQIEFALFDMEVHRAGPAPDVRAVLQGVRDRVSVLQPPSFNRFENSFSHIFAGGYAAGYYSYKWAEVLSADCFAAFEESPQGHVATGARFLAEILSVGGSRPAIESFRAFRGRAPSLDALLRHNGMVPEPA